MLYRIFTLHPEIFHSFTTESLISRGISKDIIKIELCNWRENFGLKKYRQVDDRPYGGGSGMVLMPEPICNCLSNYNAVSQLFQKPAIITQHSKMLPNNANFFRLKSQDKTIKKATILLTPRGFPLNQNTIAWLSEFKELNILCGRYEGFDARVNELVDMELSLGNYVLNGGEVGAMALIEATARLLPDFVTKSESVAHDSFSTDLNFYSEINKFVKPIKPEIAAETLASDELNLFDDSMWRQETLPKIEHPQYTRPENWLNWSVPAPIISGDHKAVQNWRQGWFKFDK